MRLSKSVFLESMERNPVIPAIKNDEWLNCCKRSDCEVAYIIYGNICNIGDIVRQVKEMGKYAIVHADLIDGLAPKEISIDFLKKYTDTDGIVSTKSSLISRANELGFFTVQRFFMTDAFSYANIEKYVKNTNPDMVELLPAGLHKVIRYLLETITQPLIISGLVLDKEDAIGALSLGACAVTTTNRVVWES